MKTVREKLSITLRPATVEDSDFVFETKKQALGPYIEKQWGWDETWQREYHDEKFDPTPMSVILVDGRPAGYLIVQEEEWYTTLESIHLMPAYQNKGIGTTLIRQVIDNSRRKRRPVRLKVLIINPAIKLYQRLGFEIVGETATHYIMECCKAE